MYYMLFYDYVKDILERRAPHRPEHLALLTKLQGEGKLVMAGAWNNPVDGAAFLFKADAPAVVEDFVKADPYKANGLVTSHRIKEWNVVVGG